MREEDREKCGVMIVIAEKIVILEKGSGERKKDGFHQVVVYNQG